MRIKHNYLKVLFHFLIIALIVGLGASMIILPQKTTATDEGKEKEVDLNTSKSVDKGKEANLAITEEENEKILSFWDNGNMDEITVPCRCLSKTFSYFDLNDEIVIYVAMGDRYTYNQNNGILPNYDTIKTNGYPIFYVSDTEDINDVLDEDGSNWGNKTTRSNSELIINGYSGYFEEIFLEKDLSKLNIIDYGKIDDYYTEKVSIDFSALKKGDKGVLNIGFGWVFFKDNPYAAVTRGTTCARMENALYYYVGDNGVGFSYNSFEEASNNAITNEEMKYPEIDKKPLCSSESVYITWLDNKKTFSHGSVISCTFKINNTKTDDKFFISVKADNGIHIVSPTSLYMDEATDNLFSVDFYLDDGFKSGVIRLYVEAINKSIYTESCLYCLHNDDCDYLSNNSIDELSAYSEELYNKLSQIDRRGELYSYERDKGTRTVPSYTVRGYVNWEDKNGTVHPARNVKVEIRGTNSSLSTSWLLASVTTNASGFYTATIPFAGAGTGDNIFVRIKPEGLNITVQNSSGSTYEYNSNIYYGLQDGDTVTISYTANRITDLGKSFGVHQAFELGNRYIYSLENNYMGNIIISYPDSTYGSSCYYPPNKIYILSARWSAWDVLLHEYGHYVEYQYGIANSDGHLHSLTDNLADTLGNKSDGITLAWSEGWASYFSIQSQIVMNGSAMNIPSVGDTAYNDFAGVYFDLENIPSSMRKGEANEATVAATLFDITDGISATDNDYISCSNNTIWNLTILNHCTTLSDFINAFYNSYYGTQIKLNLGSTLSYHMVSAQLSSSVAGLGGSTPTFSWIKQGGSSLYPNNSFKLAFYDSSYNLILKTTAVNATTKTLTSTQWNQIKNTGSTVYCCVETSQTSSPYTGPYYSNLISISIP